MATLSKDEADLFANAMASLLAFDALKLPVENIPWADIPQKVAELALDQIVPNGADLINEYISTGAHREVEETVRSLNDLGDKLKVVYPNQNLEKGIGAMLSEQISRRQIEIPAKTLLVLKEMVEVKYEEISL